MIKIQPVIAVTYITISLLILMSVLNNTDKRSYAAVLLFMMLSGENADKRLFMISMLFVLIFIEEMIADISNKDNGKTRNVIFILSLLMSLMICIAPLVRMYINTDTDILLISETVYFVYIILISLLNILMSIMLLRKNDISQKRIGMTVVVSLLVIVKAIGDYYGQRYISSSVVILIELLVLYLSYLDKVYLIDENKSGVIVFDTKRNILNYNQQILSDIPQLKHLYVDKNMGSDFVYYAKFNELMDKCEYSETLSYDDRYLKFSCTPLLINKKNKGYRIEINDVTETRLLETADDKKDLRYYSIISKQLSPKALKEIVKDVKAISNKAVIVYIDVFDINRYIRKYDKDEVLKYLNDSLTYAEKVIASTGGITSKINGDRLLACYIDEDINQSIYTACKMALELSVSERYNIGIDTGEVTGGFIGNEYNLIGETVIVAEKLRELSKPGKVVVSKEIVMSLMDKASFKNKGSISVTGIDNNVELFEINNMK